MAISDHFGPTAFACNPTPVTTSAGLAVTYTGLCLSNPIGSTVTLEIVNISGGFVVNSAAITMIGVITGYNSATGVNTHTTPLTIYNKISGAASTSFQGLVDSSCQLPENPVWSDWLSVTASTTTVGSYFNKDIDGAINIPPGGYLAIGTTVASGSSGFYGRVTWREIPIVGTYIFTSAPSINFNTPNRQFGAEGGQPNRPAAPFVPVMLRTAQAEWFPFTAVKTPANRAIADSNSLPIPRGGSNIPALITSATNASNVAGV